MADVITDVRAANQFLMNDMTNQYNTQLPPELEAKFRQQYAPGDSYDYDMRGAFQQGIGQGDNGHYPDTFKKPNHPTFSDQSQYHGVDGQYGGTWQQQGDQWTFAPGPTNLQVHGMDALQNYMQQNDPTVTLIPPPVSYTQAY